MVCVSSFIDLCVLMLCVSCYFLAGGHVNKNHKFERFPIRMKVHIELVNLQLLGNNSI